ncbi:MAG: DUF3990 domain-containing protein [Prevotella sp.]|nr:DUF3990 domain-containing protein [Prevotella sp.]
MDIFHGSYTTVKVPRIVDGRYTKDFGKGFYCTQLKQQAERWAGKYDTPTVNVYDYEAREDLDILEFKGMTDEWLDFVVACRNGQPHHHDIVIGAMADDQIYNYIADFMRGVINREQFWALAKFKYPTHQIAFCTDAALKSITFKNVYSL